MGEDKTKTINSHKEKRIDAQYYVNREIPDKNYEFIMKKTSAFLIKCKNIVLEQKEIKEIRTSIDNELSSEKGRKRTF